MSIIIGDAACCGDFSGINTVVVPLYISEISPVSLRGSMGVCHQMAVVSTIMLSQLFGLSAVSVTFAYLTMPTLCRLFADSLPTLCRLFADSLQIFGRPDNEFYAWRILFALPLLFAAFQLALLPWLPESPKYLFIKRRKEDVATKGSFFTIQWNL